MPSPADLAHDGAAALLRLASLRAALDTDVLDSLADGTIRPRPTDEDKVTSTSSTGVPDPVHRAVVARWDALEEVRRIETALQWCATTLPALERRVINYMEGLK